jgi:hypothetical protein
MYARSLCAAAAIGLVTVAGCSSTGLVDPGSQGPSGTSRGPNAGSGSTGAPSSGSSGSSGSGSSGSSSGSSGSGSSGSGTACCAHDSIPSWCSTNWRLEKDASGCEAWAWDTRKPLPNEDEFCFPKPDDPPPPPPPVDGGPTNVCCPLDATPSDCMYLGGASTNGCYKTCDFWCSDNWRIETDSAGCKTWSYDLRKPRPGENQFCQSVPDAG